MGSLARAAVAIIVCVGSWLAGEGWWQGWMAPEGWRQRVELRMDPGWLRGLVPQLRNDGHRASSSEPRSKAWECGGGGRRWYCNWRADASHPEAGQRSSQIRWAAPQEREGEGRGHGQMGALSRGIEAILCQGAQQVPREAGRKIKEENQECQETKLKALAAIQDLFVNGPERAEGGRRGRPPRSRPNGRTLSARRTIRWKACQGWLAAALQSGGKAKEKARRQMMEILGIRSDKTEKFETPPRRRTAVRSVTPPSSKTTEKHAPSGAAEETATYGGPAANDDPYLTSPNNLAPSAESPLERLRPRASGARMNIKMQGRAPSQPRVTKATLSEKLEAKRRESRWCGCHQRDLRHGRRHGHRQPPQDPPRRWIGAGGSNGRMARQHTLCLLVETQAMCARGDEVGSKLGLFRHVPGLLLRRCFLPCDFFGLSARFAEFTVLWCSIEKRPNGHDVVEHYGTDDATSRCAKWTPLPTKGVNIYQSHVPPWARLLLSMPTKASGATKAAHGSQHDHDAIRPAAKGSNRC